MTLPSSILRSIACGLVPLAACYSPDSKHRDDDVTGSEGSSDGGTDSSVSTTATTVTSASASSDEGSSSAAVTSAADGSSSDGGTCDYQGCYCITDDSCGRGLICRGDSCEPLVCGDTLVEGDEQCDDGNQTDGDGCDADCTITELLAVEASYRNTCVLIEGGRVRCWGFGGAGVDGQGNPDNLGDDEVPASLPDIMVPAAVLDLSLGDSHVMSMIEATDLHGWGAGYSGQLGIGNTSVIGDDEYPSVLVPITFDSVPVQVAGGGSHSCVRLMSGTLHCWGSAGGGALGYGNLTNLGDDENAGVAGNVPLGSAADWVSAGVGHTCAVLSTGDIRCWGSGYNGELGLGLGASTVVGDDETADAVAALSFEEDALEISCGYQMTCALFEGGIVRCWGTSANGESGQGSVTTIGDDETAELVAPIDLGGGAAQHVTVGDNHACAHMESGEIRCWGLNAQGQLGLANTMNLGDDELPSAVGPIDVGSDSVTRVDAGGLHTCAILERRRLKCWGNNADGELGQGNLDIIGDDEVPADAPDVPVLVVPG
ncbi:MAG: hypothetical protein K1X88_03675 [Nannocystaceae bacterium]|nr:hypothetical protein [Nannocystaceae bacterium]